MPKWLVTQGDAQFSAQDLSELKQMAGSGRLQPADLIQPPEASDWLYAMELPALNGCFASEPTDDDDDDFAPPTMSTGRKLLAFTLITISLAALGTTHHFWSIVQESRESAVDLGPGETMLNRDVDLMSDPPGYQAGSSRSVGNLEQGSIVTVELKQMNRDRDAGNWLQVRQGSLEGWIPADAVPPAFLFDEESAIANRALYYPEEYLSVDAGMAWLSISNENFGDGADDFIRINNLTISNSSDYAMEHVVIVVESYDGDDQVVNEAFIELEEPIPARSVSLPVGGVFPIFTPPPAERFANLRDRDRAEDIVDHLEDVEETGRLTVQNYCNEIQHTYIYEEVMDTIDHQPQDEIMVLPSSLSDISMADFPDRWKHCIDVEFDIDEGDHEGVRLRVFQLRPVID